MRPVPPVLQVQPVPRAQSALLKQPAPLVRQVRKELSLLPVPQDLLVQPVCKDLQVLSVPPELPAQLVFKVSQVQPAQPARLVSPARRVRLD